MKKFSPEMDKLCRDLIAACLETGQRIESCIACGLDMQEEQTANAEQLRVAKEMLKTFGDRTSR